MAIANEKPVFVSRFFQLCLISVLMFFILFGSLFWLGESHPLEQYLSSVSWLKVEEVNIQAGWPLSPQTVKTWLPPLVGKNLLLIRPGVLMQLMQEKPWVENVSIKKEYPNRLAVVVETKRAQAITLIKGMPHFLGSGGEIIEKATPRLLNNLDLPYLSFQTQIPESTEQGRRKWNVSEVLKANESLKKILGEKVTISQIVLGSYPQFRMFLSKPKMEVIFSFENWKTQVPILLTLLNNPPSQITQPQRINLVFPKKAIVR
jgi:cell division septal protein FtsQ